MRLPEIRDFRRFHRLWYSDTQYNTTKADARWIPGAGSRKPGSLCLRLPQSLFVSVVLRPVLR